MQQINKSRKESRSIVTAPVSAEQICFPLAEQAALAAIWVLVPFLWAIVNSFKTLNATFTAGAIIPFLNFQPTLDSWKEVLGDPQSINSLMSSAIVAAGTTLLVMVLGTPAAYSLARFEFAWQSKDIALWFLSQRVMPPVVVLVPFYIVMVQLRLIDTWTGLILLYSTFNLAFCVVIMRDIFRDVSKLIAIMPPVLMSLFVHRYLARGLTFGAVRA